MSSKAYCTPVVGHLLPQCGAGLRDLITFHGLHSLGVLLVIVSSMSVTLIPVAPFSLT